MWLCFCLDVDINEISPELTKVNKKNFERILKELTIGKKLRTVGCLFNKFRSTHNGELLQFARGMKIIDFLNETIMMTASDEMTVLQVLIDGGAAFKSM